MNLIISIILVIISAGTFFTFIDPTYQEIKDLQVVKKGYLEKQKSASTIEKKKMELKKKYLNISKTDLKKIKKFLPRHVDNVELIVDIHRIAKQNNIRNISDLSLVKRDKSSDDVDSGRIEIKEEGSYESVVLSLSFVSKYDNFKRFLADLKKSLRLVDISNISIRRQSERNRDGEEVQSDNFRISLSIRTYWLKK